MTNLNAIQGSAMTNRDVEKFLENQQAAGSVLVKNLRQSGPAKRMRLPVTIGSSPLCDIAVNSASLKACARVIFADPKGLLRLADPSTGQEFPVPALQHFGLAASGPFRDGQNRLVAPLIQNMLAAESNWFARIPEQWRRRLGERLPQSKRLLLWFTVLAMTTVVLAIAGSHNGEQVDLSRRPLPMTYASIVDSGFGSVPSMRSYAHGMTFRFDVPQEAVAQAHILSFEAKGLEANREIIVFVNGKELLATKADKECLVAYCQQSVVVPLGTLSEAENTLFLQHGPPDSDYVVRNLLVAPLTTPSPAEGIAIQQSLALAKRGFEERGISYLNILAAARELEKLKVLLSQRLGVEQLQAEANVLSKNVHDELERMRDELWFNAAKEKQLGKFKSAKEKFESLLELNPDAASREHKKVRQELEELTELMK